MDFIIPKPSKDDMDRGIESYRVDEQLIRATAADEKTRQAIYRYPGTDVVLGRGSKTDLEVDVDACRQAGVAILRRFGGGCPVLLDTGNVIVSLTASVAGYGDNDRHFAAITSWLSTALAGIGLDGVRHEGISDLARGNRKVGGSCLYRRKGLLYYSTTLLVDPDLELMEKCLKYPPREPPYRQGRSHRDFLATLKGSGISDAGDLASQLAAVLDAAALELK